eukprot:jgi/Psemu1/8414/gm1.8414_g
MATVRSSKQREQVARASGQSHSESNSNSDSNNKRQQRGARELSGNDSDNRAAAARATHICPTEITWGGEFEAIHAIVGTGVMERDLQSPLSTLAKKTTKTAAKSRVCPTQIARCGEFEAILAVIGTGVIEGDRQISNGMGGLQQQQQQQQQQLFSNSNSSNNRPTSHI